MNRPLPAPDPGRFRPTRLTSALRGLWSSPRVWGVLAGTLPGLAAAGPLGEQVVSGDVSVNRPDGNHTVIDQGSTKAIVNWQQFSIAGDEYVQFNQPGSSALALNRVVGGDISNILGSLTANGQVFLVNPQGVYFGPNATVDVGGLVASILDIRDEDFLSGRYTFSRHPESPEGASVVNAGYLRAREGGYVVLAGDYTGNTGVVEARLGQVVLASGNRMTLDMAGDGLVSFAVDEATLSSLAGVENSGELLADGGRVVMTAQVAGDLMGTVVNNAGLVRAHGVAEHGGEIWLTAAGGDIENSGILDADGESGAGGGAVRVLGEGDIELPAGGVITARGDGSGGGGSVRVVADERLAFRLDHHIDVRGGAPNTGGFVEVSGHGGLQLAGTLKLGGGRVIIDPDAIEVNCCGGFPFGGTASSGTTSLGASFLSNLLSGGSSGSGADVFLVARDRISIYSSIDGHNSYGYAGGDLSLILGTMAGGAGSAASYGVFTGGTPTPRNTAGGTITINEDILLDGDLVINAGQDGTGKGVGDIEIYSDNFDASVNRFAAYGAIRVDGSDGSTGEIHVNAPGGVFMEDVNVTGRSFDVAGGSSTSVTVGNVSVTSPGFGQITLRGDGIKTGNLTVEGTNSFGSAQVHITGYGSGDIVLGNVTADAATYGGASIDIENTSSSGADITTGTLKALSDADFYGADINVIGVGNISILGAEAIANGRNADGSVGIYKWNNTGINVGTGGLHAKGNDARIYVQTSDSAAATDIQGEVRAETNGAGSYGNAYVTIDGAEGRADVTLKDVVALAGNSGDSDASVDIRGKNIKAETINVRAQDDADVSISGTRSVIAGKISAIGNLNGQNSGGGEIYVDSGDPRNSYGGSINITGDLTAEGNYAYIEVSQRSSVGSQSSSFGVVGGSSGSLGFTASSGGSQSLTNGSGGLAAGPIIIKNATATGLDSGSVLIDGGEGVATGGTVTTGKLIATASNPGSGEASIGIGGKDIATQDLTLEGAFRSLYLVGDTIRVASEGGIDIGSNGSIYASRSLTMVAQQGDISNVPGSSKIQADAITLAAPNGSILLPDTRIYVGDGVAVDLDGNPLTPDAELITTLQQNAGRIFTDPEPASAEINAFFQAGERLVLGQEVAGEDPNGDPDFFTATTADDIAANGYLALQLGVSQDANSDGVPDITCCGGFNFNDVDGDGKLDQDNKAGYLWLEGKVIDLGPVVGEAANIIVQWATSNDLEITGSAAPDAATQLAAAKTYLTVPDHFSRFAGTTHAPGYAAHPLAGATPAIPGIPTGPYVGNVNIPGSVNLGSANFFLLTGGSTAGLENVQTTGLVGLINVLAGPEEPPPEEPPPPPEMGELLDAVDSDEGDLEDLTNENTDPEDPESPEVNTDGDKALARVCQ